MPPKITIDKDKLYEMYIVEQKSLNEISEMLQLNRRTVTINLIGYGFKEDKKHNKRRRVDRHLDLNILSKDLYDDYITKNMTVSQLMKKYKFTRYKIKQLLKEFDIVKQENKTNVQQVYDNPELLYIKYIKEQKSIQLIASELNCSDETISRKLKQYNIETRKNHVSEEDREKSYSNYKLLLKRSRRRFNSTLRIERLRIDKQKCYICNNDKKLEVHHIKTIQEMVDNTLEYFKDVDISIKEHRYFISDLVQQRYDYNDLNNMITLCKNCHIEIHTNKTTLGLEGATTIPKGSTLEDWLPMEVLDISVKNIKR